jgi:hypothetical protein
MARPAKITREQLDEAVSAAKIRRSTPTEKALARRFGVTVSGLQKAVSRALVRIDSLSAATHKCDLMRDGSRRPDRLPLPARSDQGQ